MRHLKSGAKLNRTSKHRKLMFNNMVISLITYKSIRTTLAKAKEFRKFIEPLITISKIDTIANRRVVFSKIRNRDIVTQLFTKIGPYFLNRPGGYTRILKYGFRVGDNAPMAYMELVDYSEIVQKD